MSKSKLQVGDLVKVKGKCKDTILVDFTVDMHKFKGRTFVVNKILNHNHGPVGTTLELAPYEKDASISDVYDYEFDLEWVKQVKVALSVPSMAAVGAVSEPKQQSIKQFAMIKSPSGLNVILDGRPYTIKSDHPNWARIVEAIADKNYDALPALIDTTSTVKDFGKGRITVDKGVVYYNKQQLHGCIVQSILGLIKEGFSVEPIANFLDNLEKNPSHRAITELYGFLEYGKLPITEDGCFLTYKKVRSDFKDIHSGTFDNSIGKTCEMPRSKVDDNPNNTCSSGLHVCSYEYTKSFGDSSSKLVLCKVNPADVVSIPVDYNNTKMRCCKYVVVAEVKDKSDVLKDKALYNA